MAQSSFAKFIRHDPLTGEEAEQRNKQIGSELWHETGIAAFIPGAFPNEWDRLEIEALAIKHYGKRQQRGTGNG